MEQPKHDAASGWRGMRVERIAVLGWLLAFIAFEWARMKLDLADPAAPLHGALDIVSTLELAEIFLLVRLFLHGPREPSFGFIEAAFTVAGAAAIMLVVDSKPVFALALLACYVLLRFGLHRGDRVLALALFVFSSQYWLQAGPFIWLHDIIGRIDATVLRAALNTAGYAVGGTGTMVSHNDGSFGVNVLVGCSSSFILAIVVPAFVIALLALRGSLVRADLRSLAWLAAMTVALNWIRLFPTSLSHERWYYWHEGTGASFVALINALLVAAFVYRALREDVRKLPAPA